jgi:8-oxo-dGTP pyrophosphatase MutT (NUDIX family)
MGKERVTNLIAQGLKATNPVNLDHMFSDFSCVALLLVIKENNTELGFIRRAIHPKDPWSGQIGLPGGRKDPGDPDDVAAVFREVREEIGVFIPQETPRFRLSDIQARRSGKLLDFYMRPFVFLLEEHPALTLDPNEVDDFFWVPLAHFLDQHHQISHPIETEAGNIRLPAVRMPSGDTLWGLTYLVINDFFDRIGSHFPDHQWIDGKKFTQWRKIQRRNP